VAATVDLDADLSDWNRLTPLIRDAAGDGSSPDTADIKDAYMAYGDDFFYFRVDLNGDVDDDWLNELMVSVVFSDPDHALELRIAARFVTEMIEVELRDTDDYSYCGLSPIMLTLPFENFLTVHRNTIIFMLPKHYLDWDFDGTRFFVEASDVSGNDVSGAVSIACPSDHLNSVITSWALPLENPTATIPQAEIIIDGQFDDWDGIDPIFVDPADDIYGPSNYNILRAGMAQNDEALFFRVQFQVLAAVIPGSAPQVRFELVNPDTGEERWMTVWFNTNTVQIQDPSLLVLGAEEDASIIVTYPQNGYLGSDLFGVEFRILKADLNDFSFTPGCIRVTSLGVWTGDTTEPVYVTE
jgi:hypothetical protein